MSVIKNKEITYGLFRVITPSDSEIKQLNSEASFFIVISFIDFA